MALLLFNDLRPLTNRLVDDQNKMTSAISFERHPLFFETFHHELNAGI
jgi:hypothetical protein